jgi:hypothetical protein
MPTLKQAKRVHGSLMASELSPNGAFGFLGGKINKTDWRIEFPGGSWIQWVSAENADDNRGIRCDAAFIDEADDVDLEIIEAITKPWFSEPHSLRLSVISGTPRRGRYGLLWKAHKELPKLSPKCFSFHATGYDCPEIVDPEFLEETKRTTPPEIFAREYLCDFDAAEGLVYPMFSPELHVREAWLPFHTILVGIDHGYEDPAVFLAVGVAGHGKDQVAHVIWEYAQNHQTVEQLADVAERIHSTYPQAKWFADSSGPSQIRSYEKRTGKKIVHATHKIEDGVAVVAGLLSPRPSEDGTLRPRLFISPLCGNLIEEMGKYRRRRDPQNKERVLDDIDDKHNHSNDALRYCLLRHFGQGSGKHILTEHDQQSQFY